MKRVSTITGVGRYMPKRVVTSAELEKELRFKELGVRENTIRLINGVDTRHIAAEGEYSSDLAREASKKALEMAGIEPEDIDVIIFSSVSQDFIEPATAYVVQNDLDASNASCFDIKNACNSFITALEVADLYIISGKAETVLVVSGEVMSRYIRRKYESKEEVNSTNATLGFGDAGAAFILQAAEVEDEDTYKGCQSRLASYGQYWNEGVIWGGGTRHMAEEDKFYMKNIDPIMVQESSARAVFYFHDCMKETGVRIEDTQYFVTSQMSKFAILKVADALKIPHEKVTTQVVETGNVGASNMGVGFCMALERGEISLHSGEQIVFMGAGNGLSLGYFTLRLV